MAQMDHPAIVSIYDFGRHEGSLFFVMPLVQGTNLRAFLRQELARWATSSTSASRWPRRSSTATPAASSTATSSPRTSWCRARRRAAVRVRVMDFGLARAATESRLTKTRHAGGDARAT